MIHVLVVEDELPTARLVAKLVRQQPDFDVAGMETDGEQALQFLQNHPVDLIITDIQMPVLDGLQLLEAVHRDYPHCLTIMLTGFSQFDYARTALKLRAFDYLLKPIDSLEFARILEKAREILTKRRIEQEQQLLRRALAGLPAEGNEKNYQLLLMQAPPAFWQDWNGARLQNLLGPSAMQLSEDGGTDRFFAAPAATWTPSQIRSTAHPDSRLNSILSTEAVPIPGIKQTADMLRESLARQAVLFQGQLFWMGPVLPAPRKETPLRDMQPELAAAAACAANRRELEQCLQQMWEVSHRHGSLRADVQAYLAAVLLDPRISRQTPPEQLHRIQIQLAEILLESETREDCTQALCSCLTALQQAPVSKRETAQQMAEIAHYLQTNYFMPITVEALAKQYGYVPKTLNRLFRQYQGSRPAEYLQDLRIRHAQHLLQTRPDLMIKDIAASVGFTDQHYFSKVFQKATGHWPSEFQNTAKK